MLLWTRPCSQVLQLIPSIYKISPNWKQFKVTYLQLFVTNTEEQRWSIELFTEENFIEILKYKVKKYNSVNYKLQHIFKLPVTISIARQPVGLLTFKEKYNLNKYITT